MHVRRVTAVIGGAVMPLIAGLFAVASAAPEAASFAGAPSRFKAALQDAAYTCPHLPAGLQAALIDVESGWDATKVDAGTGTKGLAQLSARMWTAWGEDADGDGTSSPLDSADAIDAQARMLCSYYRTAVQSNERGDRLSLALAAYRLGWNRVADVGLANLPETREYIAEIKALAPVYAQGLGVTNSSRSLYTPLPNPRSASGAVTWARAQAGDFGWYNLCLNFMARSYGWNNSGTRYAIDHWLSTPNSMRHHRQRNAPAGALMFWDTGLRAGHVAIALGNGYVATNDVITPGKISIVPSYTIDEKWNARYLGWTPPYCPGGV